MITQANKMYLIELLVFLSQKIGTKNVYVVPCDLLPEKIDTPAYIIFNTMPLKGNCESRIGHWIALHISADGSGSYFDSYGFPPTVTSIKHFIRMHCRRLNYNKIQIQQLQSDVCGKYAAMFLYYMHKNFSMECFVNYFSRNFVVNDILVDKMYQKYNN